MIYVLSMFLFGVSAYLMANQHSGWIIFFICGIVTTALAWASQPISNKNKVDQYDQWVALQADEQLKQNQKK